MTLREEPSAAVQALANLLERQTGQQITPSRFWRVETALAPVMRKHAIPDLDALTAVLRDGQQTSLQNEAVDALLNNESFFFRDTGVFATLKRDILPELRTRRAASGRLNIWCAGCSTGQEAYSLAMLFADEAHRWADFTVRIIATDISTDAIEQARAGRYSQFEIQRGLSVAHMLRYFDQQGDHWVVKDKLRSAVQFSKANILTRNESALAFDLILCRNVLMYFAPANRAKVFANLAEAAREDSFLVMGAAETIIGHTTDFRVSPDHRGFYRRASRRAVPVAVTPQFVSGMG